jgi:hypothetical protein
MRKLVLTITMIALCGLFAAVLGRPGSQSIAASPAIGAAIEAAPSAQMPDLATPDSEDSECDPAAVSEDAASCFDGGWEATLTCCFVSGRALERFRLNGRSKCCGACFQ